MTVIKYAGVNARSGRPLWFTDSEGKYWIKFVIHRTPKQLLMECQSTIQDLTANHPELATQNSLVQLEKKENLLFRMARLLRNTDGLHPSTAGPAAGNLLLELRGLDHDRYDKEVMAKEPPAVVVNEDPEARYLRLCRAAGAKLEAESKAAYEAYSAALKEIEKEFSTGEWPWYKI